MLIWDIIRDWFVMYVFGGCTSEGWFQNVFIGYDVESDQQLGTLDVDVIKMPSSYIGADVSISLGDWLSTTATLIVMIAVLIGLFYLVRYFFRMFSGLLTLK